MKKSALVTFDEALVIIPFEMVIDGKVIKGRVVETSERLNRVEWDEQTLQNLLTEEQIATLEEDIIDILYSHGIGEYEIEIS